MTCSLVWDPLAFDWVSDLAIILLGIFDIYLLLVVYKLWVRRQLKRSQGHGEAAGRRP